ncbi:hypothetical protein U9M48_039175 [Paspalum notatum var. saurae]|uniref:Transcription factor CBF/NF-Y/archaeal histone domain-containing protein n=1 Tax=Paspalum notatum var. saurae TaxID=547442 RepID=A0AAQ3UKW8_PASNO
MDPMDIVGKSKEDVSLPKCKLTYLRLPRRSRVMSLVRWYARMLGDVVWKVQFGLGLNLAALLILSWLSVCFKGEYTSISWLIVRVVAPRFLVCQFDDFWSVKSGASVAGNVTSSTMFKIIKEMLPPDVRVARDAQDLLVECCVEFINLLSSESNEVCSREEKKTIAPEHVLKALSDLGFREYIDEVYAAYEQHKLDTLVSGLSKS